MSLVFEHRQARRRFLLRVAALASVAALFAFADRAHAAETIYWDNFAAEPPSVAFANIDGSGGGSLNLTGATLEAPEGMAYDPVTNRIYIGSSHPEKSDLGEIFYVNLDGSGSGVLATPGVAVEEPEGVAIDPVTRTIYWVNTAGNGEADGSINWAKLDGSGGGMLNTSGATVDSPYKLAIDTVHGKVYWANNGNPLASSIFFANTDNTGGGGELNLSGATPPESITALVVDPAGNRVFWVDTGVDKISFASLAGGGGGDVDLAGATFKEPYGLAFDPTNSTLYWANYDQGNGGQANAIGFVRLGGVGGAISMLTAPVQGPQDPVVIKSPSGAGAPVVTRSKKSRSSLSCSQGTWGADFPGSFVYQSPRAFAYQWTRNGKALKGATKANLSASSGGKYACTVTATNQSGSTSQTSKGLNVKAAKIKLTTKKKASAAPGDVVTFKVKAVNQGDVKSKSAKVCVKLPKAAQGDLKAPKCKKLGKLKGRGKKSATLKIKVLPGAGGTDKLTIQVKGSAGKSAKSKIVVG